MTTIENKVWDHIERWGRCSVWHTSLTKIMGMEQFRPFETMLKRNDQIASIANLYVGQEVAEEDKFYLLDAMKFYLLREWSVKLLVPHVWFLALHDEDADDTFAVYQKAWPPHSGLRYGHTVKFGPPQLLIPKSEFKLCEVKS